MQSMTPALFKGKSTLEASPRGPVNVKVYKIDSKTKTESLLKSFLPKLKYGTKFLPHRTKQYRACERAFSAQTCLIFQTNSILCSELNRLRLNLAESSIDLSYVKSTILQLFCKRFGNEGLQEICKGPILLAYGTSEPAKFKSAFSLIEGSSRLILLSGRIDGHVFTPKECRIMISDLPSKRELIAELISLFQSPMLRLTRILKSPIFDLKKVLDIRHRQLNP